MNARLKGIIKRVFRRELAAYTRFQTQRLNMRGLASYSQEGEDRVLASLLFKLHDGPLAPKGFYVDVGAHDPFRFSNTNFFYRRGWSGINIDAAPGSMAPFAAHRSRDTNLEIGVGKDNAEATFYVFNEPALSTFDPYTAKSRAVPPRRVIREVRVEILPLRDIFAKYLPANQRIDFMTIDVEGRDLDVLQSNDWTKYRPSVVLAEIFGKSLEHAAHDPVTQYLSGQEYTLYAKTVNTAFFIDAATTTTD